MVCSSCAASFDASMGTGFDLGSDSFSRAGVHFARHLVQSMPYQHYVFEKPDCIPREGDPLFVFLDGDGNSWIRNGRVSEDPTPPDPIALDLLGLESTCGIYIARPCAFGLVRQDEACEPSVWTTKRYSQEIVDSLSGVIDRFVSPGRSLVLVGYSGGGLLASVLSKERTDVVGLMTLAANLDLSAWVAYHGYTAEVLRASAPSPFPQRPGVAQVHAFGSMDGVSPWKIVVGTLDPVARSAIVVLEGADHSCCWATHWPELRELIQQRIDNSVRSRSSSVLR
jgi:pimeloyl-ACP methyl ester carboxylesterase